MITRKYFFSAKWMHDDGSASFANQDGIITVKSWFAIQGEAFKKIRESSTEELKNFAPNGHLIVVSFNRV